MTQNTGHIMCPLYCDHYMDLFSPFVKGLVQSKFTMDPQAKIVVEVTIGRGNNTRSVYVHFSFCLPISVYDKSCDSLYFQSKSPVKYKTNSEFVLLKYCL